MRRKKFFFILLGLMLVMSLSPVFWFASAHADDEGPVRAAETDPYWVASYWNNTSLAGSPVLTRNEPTIDYNWGFGSPAPEVSNDNFSARWTRYIYTSAGVYRFTATTDDGMRVFVDDQLILNQWRVQAPTTYVVDRQLSEGHHLVRVEYFEAGGEAVARFSWERLGSPEPPPVVNWRGEYFNNRDLAGAPALIRDDPNIDFRWGRGSPAPGVVNSDNFSTRWTRTLSFEPGNYRFSVTTDDGARLWVNNARIINEWREQSTRTFTSDIYLPGGAIPVRLEYFDALGDATIILQWQRADAPSPTPTPSSGKWRGDYFGNPNLSGAPAMTRNDSSIDFNWGYGSPALQIPPDNFSVRWTRTIRFDAGEYRFTTETDDGVRLYVDGNLVIDRWFDQGRTKYSANVRLSKGNHTIVMDYYERFGAAFARLNISRSAGTPEPIGNIITCVPPQPQNYAWIKLYRLNGDNRWYSIGRGIGSIEPTGYLKIDGLPVDVGRFGQQGEPYKVEMWVNGSVAFSTGDFLTGQPQFLVRPFADNYTPWQCPRR
jgi:hypothetical protein